MKNKCGGDRRTSGVAMLHVGATGGCTLGLCTGKQGYRPGKSGVGALVCAKLICWLGFEISAPSQFNGVGHHRALPSLMSCENDLRKSSAAMVGSVLSDQPVSGANKSKKRWYTAQARDARSELKNGFAYVVGLSTKALKGQSDPVLQLGRIIPKLQRTVQ